MRSGVPDARASWSSRNLPVRTSTPVMPSGLGGEHVVLDVVADHGHAPGRQAERVEAGAERRGRRLAEDDGLEPRGRLEAEQVGPGVQLLAAPRHPEQVAVHGDELGAAAQQPPARG